jgi:hypothetical protein
MTIRDLLKLFRAGKPEKNIFRIWIGNACSVFRNSPGTATQLITGSSIDFKAMARYSVKLQIRGFSGSAKTLFPLNPKGLEDPSGFLKKKVQQYIKEG